MPKLETTIQIKGKVGYEDEISVAQAAQIIAFLNGDPTGSPSLGDETNDSDGGSRRNEARSKGRLQKQVESAREALDVSGAATNAEKIVALGAYVLQDGVETFKAEDVKAQFRRARETAPANFARDLGVAIQAGWLADEGNEYCITSKIQGIFDGDFKFPKSGTSTTSRKSGNNTNGRRTAKPQNSKTGKPEAFATIDEFPTRLDGVPAYSEMKSYTDKLLWGLQFARTHQIKGLTNKEVVWLTDHLGAGIPSKQVSAAFNSLKKAGYANRSTQDNTLRLTDDGEARLASLSPSGD